MIELNLDGIKDSETKNAFENIIKILNENFVLKGKWQFFDINFKRTGGEFLSHSLGIKPKDIIVLYTTAGDITIGSSSVTKVSLVPATIGMARVLVGKYMED